MKWYVMNVFSSKENSIKEEIEKVLKSKNYDQYVKQILVPKEKYFQVRKGKKIKAERNFFPGYVFIECDMNGELMQTISNVKGVLTFLKSSNGNPIPMSKKEVDEMLKKTDDSITDDITIDKLYAIGQKVTVIDGPFASFRGKIIEINKTKKTLKVEVTIFSRKTPIDLNVEQIVVE